MLSHNTLRYLDLYKYLHMQKLPKYLIFCKLHYITDHQRFLQVLWHHTKGSRCPGFPSERALRTECPGFALEQDSVENSWLISTYGLGEVDSRSAPAEPVLQQNFSTARIPPSFSAPAQAEHEIICFAAREGAFVMQEVLNRNKYSVPSDARLARTHKRGCFLGGSISIRRPTP